MITVTNEQRTKIETILQQLESAGSREPTANRRGAERMQIRMTLQMVLLSSRANMRLPVYTRNLSISGMGFVSRRPFKPDERVVIELAIRNLPPRQIYARTTFTRYVGGGYYESGAAFMEAAPLDHLPIPRHWIESKDN